MESLGEKIKIQSKKILETVHENKILDIVAKKGLSQIPIVGDILVELYDSTKEPETTTNEIIALLKQFQTETDDRLELFCEFIKNDRELILKSNNGIQELLDSFPSIMNKLDIIETKGDLTFVKLKKNLLKLEYLIKTSETKLLEKIEELKLQHLQTFDEQKQTFDITPNKEFLEQVKKIKEQIISEYEKPDNNKIITSLKDLSGLTYVPQRYTHLRTKKTGTNIVEYSLNLIKSHLSDLEIRKNLRNEVFTGQNKIERIRLEDKFLKRRSDMNEDNLSQIETKFSAQLSKETKKNISTIRKIRKQIAAKRRSIDMLPIENIIPIVGDYGSGKTFFSFKIAYELSKSDDFSTFYIPLGQLNKHKDFEDHLVEDIFEFSVKKYGLKMTFEEFMKEIVKGKIIFILDALDELSTELDHVVAQGNLQHVIKLSKECVVVLTGRHTYFTDHMEQLFVHNELVKLLDFNKEEIQTFLYRVLPENELKIKEIMEVVEEKRIEVLATKPLFLFVIYKHFDKLNEYPIINEAVILRTLTEEWIRHDVIKQKFSSEEETKRIEERQRISEVLAFRHYREGQLISLDLVKEEVDQELQYDATQSIERYYNEAVHSTFLVKESENRFRFIVKPIVEYLVASRVLEDIKKRKPILLEHASKINNKETINFLLGLIEVQWAIEPFILDKIKSDESYEEIKNFKNNSSELLDRILEEREIESGMNVGNLLSLLLKSGNLHSKHDLQHLILDGMDASTTNISKSKLVKSRLNRANLSGCDLSDADFSNAELNYADLRGANLTNTNFSGAKMINAILSGANLTNTNFSNVVFRNAIAKEVIFYEDPTVENIELVRQDSELTSSIKQIGIISRLDPKLMALISQSNPKYDFKSKRKKKTQLKKRR